MDAYYIILIWYIVIKVTFQLRWSSVFFFFYFHIDLIVFNVQYANISLFSYIETISVRHTIKLIFVVCKIHDIHSIQCIQNSISNTHSTEYTLCTHTHVYVYCIRKWNNTKILLRQLMWNQFSFLGKL